MRLVDVDELIEYFDGDLEGYDNREYILHMLDSKGRSARVEAIPVEWLKQKANDLAYAYWRGVKNKVTLPMKDLPLVIETMVQYWRVENEQDRGNRL